MDSWAAKRRLVYFGIVFGVIVAVVAGIFVLSLDKETSCFDGVQNNGEVGIDCGGPCERLCASEVADLVVRWSRPIFVKVGIYNAVALIENPNPSAGSRRINYSFKLYDTNNLLVVERRGNTFVNPGERFAVLEDAVQVGERVPLRAQFSFTHTPEWARAPEYKTPLLVSVNEHFDRSEVLPRVRATVENRSLVDARDVEVVALLFDERENLMSASRTVVDYIEKEGSATVSLLFPRHVEGAPARIEIIPRINTFNLRTP